jgi:hypothetical protein
LVREFRVYAMRTLGDLKLAIGGRENPGNFWDWETKGLSLRAIACCFVSVSQAQFPPQRKRKSFFKERNRAGEKLKCLIYIYIYIYIYITHTHTHTHSHTYILTQLLFCPTIYFSVLAC